MDCISLFHNLGQVSPITTFSGPLCFLDASGFSETGILLIPATTLSMSLWRKAVTGPKTDGGCEGPLSLGGAFGLH